ncbi:hypothetical protein AB0L71_28165 [Streptomyces sp. NPDC052052]|uniref:hypothetical protein n=1 Tax=Streptomyces sp. NPDC052052 TaxID=3154756 RepID=UPI0034364DE3
MKDDLPPFVTFATGAKLLKDLDLVDSITVDGLREMARNPKNQGWWKFGDGPTQTPYIPVGKTRTMETGIFLSMFRTGPRRGGRGRKPEAS